MQTVDLAIIGGGPAGMAAAIGAHEQGIEDIVILERENALGGILNQCIHNGFGLHAFKEELTGPEYAERYIRKVTELGIPVKLGTMVLDITPDKEITAVNPKGMLHIRAKAIILAMGCRERPRGALNIPGTRPVGIYTAGTAQKFVNLNGYLPGREVVILGSGDIGLIMARRMTLEGAEVKAVVELMPYSTGLKRNIVQCLDDYDIPLLLSHTVTEIIGRHRIEGVKVSAVDENQMPVPGSEQFISCDTLLLSVGLLPENELSMAADVSLSPVTGGAVVNERLETTTPGIFACGNVLHVHDLVDFVSEESMLAGRNAARYLQNPEPASRREIPIRSGQGVRYTVPSFMDPDTMDEVLTIRFRVNNVYRNCYICLYFDADRVYRRKARILTPGEMESVVLKKEMFTEHKGVSSITITAEEATNA
ncbi:MAG: FAD-dependent oxidoreductase [Clostridiales bacterium]|nr:FAD-dependent oxidoreductase [Clostridiales bacterium]